jgi:hypothetical protein
MEALLTALWGTSLRKTITSIAAAISAVCGAVVGLPPAWSAIGLPELATRQWTRTEIYHPIKTAQSTVTKQVIDLQIDIANGKLDQLDNARTALEIEKLKVPDDSIKARVDSHIHKIDRDSAAINDQIKTLRGIQAQPQ